MKHTDAETRAVNDAAQTAQATQKGGWTQAPDGTVVLVPAATLPREARAPLEAEAARLTAWLDGDVVRSIYQSPLARAHPS